MVGFWVQRIGTPKLSQETQILQPIHSQISSTCPSRTLFGRNGSAIDGRAAPMKSSTPRRTSDAMRAGEV